MDPLSITASIIAILEVASGTGGAVRKLRSLRKAPEELEFLFNELEALRNVLLIVHRCLERIKNTQQYLDIADPLGSLLRGAKQAVTDFEALLEYRLRRNEKLDTHGRRKVDRSEWLRAGSTISRVRKQIRVAQRHLNSALTALNLTIREHFQQDVLQIQSIQLGRNQVTTLTNATDQALLSHLSAYAPAHGASNNFASETIPSGSDHSLQSSHLETSIQGTALPGTIADPGMISITATLSRHKCGLFCGCQCHARTTGMTPIWLQSVIGKLMFDYTSLIYTKPCNIPKCQKSAGKSSFMYQFPTWMACKIIVLSSHAESPEWSLQTYTDATLNRQVFVYQAAEINNVAFVRKGLEDRVVGPHMLKGDISLVECALDRGSMDVYLTLVKSGFPDIMQILTAGRPLWPGVASAVVQHLNLDPEDVSDCFAFTRLHQAVVFLRAKGEDYWKDLVEQRQAEVNSKDRSGQTPLHWACILGSLPLVRALLACGADPNAQNVCLGRPLGSVYRRGSISYPSSVAREIAQALLDHGGIVDYAECWGYNSLFSAKDPGIIRLILQHAPHLNRAETGIHYFAAGSDSPAMEEFFKHDGADYGHFHWGQSIAHNAIRTNRLTALTGIRHVHNAYPLEPRPVYTQSGSNFLHLAGLHSECKLIRELARWDLRGHDPYAEDDDGDTPDRCFYGWRDNCCWAIRELFEDEEAAWIALMESAARQNGCEYIPYRPFVVVEAEDLDSGYGSDDGAIGLECGTKSLNGNVAIGSPVDQGRDEEDGVDDYFVDALETVETD